MRNFGYYVYTTTVEPLS